MYTRGLALGVLVVVSVLVAGCGGDDTDSTANALACDPMTQTMPVQCPKSDPMICPPPMYTAVTNCMPTGRLNPNCSCVLTSSLNMGQSGAGAQPGGSCGNGRIEPALGEQCDPMVAVSATCAQMMPGTTGTITCNPAGGAMQCTLNTTMCSAMPATPMGGQGG